MDTHLRPLAPGVFEYTEELFDALVEQNAVLLSGTHLEPVAENGQVVGLRLFGVRAEGPLARLGLQNGDVVRSLNGHGVGTPAGALEAYSAVRRAPVIEVLFTRAGAEQRVRLQRRN